MLISSRTLWGSWEQGPLFHVKQLHKYSLGWLRQQSWLGEPHLAFSKMETRVLELQSFQSLGSGQKRGKEYRVHCPFEMGGGVAMCPLACLLALPDLSVSDGASSAGLGIIMSRWLPFHSRRDRQGSERWNCYCFPHRMWKVWGGREAVQNEEARVRRDLLTHCCMCVEGTF